MNTFSFWQGVAETPWWMYLLLAYFLSVGWQATKPRVISIHHLFILLSILIFLSSGTFVQASKFNSYHALIWFVAIIPGVFLGWAHFSILKIKAIRNANKLQLPGTWSLLIIGFVLFTVQYYYHFQFILDHAFFQSHAMGLMIFYGLFTGIFFGRLIYSINCLQTGPFVS